MRWWTRLACGMAGMLAAWAALAQEAAPVAQWRLTPGGVEAKGLRALEGGDGATLATDRAGKSCLTNQPGSSYLYFDADAAVVSFGADPLYLVVDYFDAIPGGMVSVEYDSAAGDAALDSYRPSEEQWGGWMSGGKTWKTGVFRLSRPRLAGRQNLGGDFRLSGTSLCVASVSITRALPANAKQLAQAAQADVKRLVEIGPRGQLIIGGFDTPRKEDALAMARSLEQAMPGLKSLGATSHEGYVRWNLCEPEQGRYDWSVYDAYVEVYRKYGLKWVPFLIVGSPYSLPDWYYKQPGSQGYVCLEHGEASDVQSLWNPVLREHVARFIQAFCEHYGPSGVIESILLGVTGNYGEAIYVVTGNDWTADIHGPYHTHPGYWAGDPYAAASFRQWLTHKYGDAAALGKAWGTTIADFKEVKPFSQKDAPNDRAWVDFCTWYIASMTDWSRFWMQETRKHFPKGEIYLCTGGHAPPEHGSDFGLQCKAAAEIGGGVRITNEGSNYPANFSLTRWVASAGRQYGAYYSFEPAGEVNAEGVIARIYNATASGARGLHYYYPNVFGSEKANENFIRWGGQFQQRKPIVEIYVYYPETYILLKGNKFLDLVQPLRDCFDFGYLSDAQILDDGLTQAKALILMGGNIVEASVWRRVTNWVQAGGLVLYADGIGRLRTVEGSEAAHEALFAPGAQLGKGRVATFAGDNGGADYRAFLARELSTAPELSAPTRAMVAADGQDDGVFVTLCAPNTLLWLNYTADKVVHGAQHLAPYAISEQRLMD